MSSADWWAKQLGAQPQQPVGRPDNTPMPPTQQPLLRMPQPAYVPPASKAQSASQTQSCPECGGNNYMSVQNAAPRCYDCGYPLTQAGSRYGALTGATVEGNAKSAQGNDVANNWNPQGIIGRVN
jgi:hypothetical protein